MYYYIVMYFHTRGDFYCKIIKLAKRVIFFFIQWERL